MTDAQREHSRFAAIFAGGTLISRALGLVRDLVWVALIPTASLSSFLVAFRFPNMLREIVGEGASNAAFVPVFSETLEKESQEKFRELVAAAMSAMLLLLTALTVVGILLLPTILGGIDTLETFTQREGVPQERIDLMTTLAVWTFPYLLFIGMSVFCMAPLYTLKHYFTPSWSPALLNIAIIAACLLLRDTFAEPAYALIVGVWAGGIAQLAVQYIALGRIAGVWLPSFKLMHPGVRTIFLLLIPVTIGQAAGEVNRLVDLLFAASLPEEDTVRTLFLANRLVQLPLSVFGVATSVAILPSLSKLAAKNQLAEMRDTLLDGLRQTYFLIFPAMLGLMVMGRPLIRLLFERGYFEAAHTERTYTALLIYAAGLLSFAWVKVLVTGFFAQQDTRTPVLIATGSMLFNILLNFVLIGPLGYRGLALSTTIAFTLNALFLYLFLNHRLGRLWNPDFLGGLLRMTIAALMTTAITYGALGQTTRLFPDDTLSARLAIAIIPIAIAAGTYAGLAAALNIPELKNFASVFRRR